MGNLDCRPLVLDLSNEGIRAYVEKFIDYEYIFDIFSQTLSFVPGAPMGDRIVIKCFYCHEFVVLYRVRDEESPYDGRYFNCSEDLITSPSITCRGCLELEDAINWQQNSYYMGYPVAARQRTRDCSHVSVLAVAQQPMLRDAKYKFATRSLLSLLRRGRQR